MPSTVQFDKLPEVGVPKAPPAIAKVPLVAGKSSTVVPATAGSCSVILPLVEPTKTIDICFPYRTTQRCPLGTVTVAPELMVIGPTDSALNPVLNV